MENKQRITWTIKPDYSSFIINRSSNKAYVLTPLLHNSLTPKILYIKSVIFEKSWSP